MVTRSIHLYRWSLAALCGVALSAVFTACASDDESSDDSPPGSEAGAGRDARPSNDGSSSTDSGGHDGSVTHDANTDTGADADTDTGVDADTDTGVDADTDTGADADTDTGVDTGDGSITIEAGVPEAGADAEAGDPDAGGPLKPFPVQIVNHAYTTCVRYGTGKVYCWGENAAGQIGDGSKTNRGTPTEVSGLTDAIDITTADSSGRREYSFSCAVRANGTAVCWGNDDVGQLGDGTTQVPGDVHNEHLVPVAVSGLTDATQITAGGSHACALRSNHTVVCWGANNGQLGDGTTTTTPSPTPVAVVGLTDVVEISAASGTTCARRSNGKIACWGKNDGMFGNGSTTGSPAQVDTGVNDATQISLGRVSCSTRMSGEVNCSGYATQGSLGDGSAYNDNNLRTSPVRVVGLGVGLGVGRAIFVSIGATAADSSSCAVRVDADSGASSGTVRCWGANSYGTVGNQSSNDARTAMAVVGGPTDAVATANGATVSCALRANGHVVCWGYNYAGVLLPGRGMNPLDDDFIPIPFGPAEITGLPGLE